MGRQGISCGRLPRIGALSSAVIGVKVVPSAVSQPISYGALPSARLIRNRSPDSEAPKYRSPEVVCVICRRFDPSALTAKGRCSQGCRWVSSRWWSR